MECRTLKSEQDRGYLVQLEIGHGEIMSVIRPEDLMTHIRDSLARRIAACLFEKIEPKILEALKGD